MNLESSSITTAVLLRLIQQGALVLTVNRRLATFLQQILKKQPQFSYDQNQASIFPINEWLEKLWQTEAVQSLSSKRLLSPVAQEIVWEKLMSGTEIGSNLLRLSATARLAIEAWDMMQKWHIPFEELQSYPSVTEDTFAFIEWTQCYQSLCMKNQWIDSGGVIDFLEKKHLLHKQNLTYSQIILVGFEEYTPLLLQFLRTISLHNVRISSVFLVPEEGHQVSYRVKTKRSEEEFLYVGQWVKECLRSCQEPEIHIVVPKLDFMRAKVQTVFKEYFPDISFNIAAPIPLLEYPMVKIAYHFLKMLVDEVDLVSLSYLLHSPFLGIKEYSNRCALVSILYQVGERKWSWLDLLKKMESLPESQSYANCPDLIGSLRTIFSQMTSVQYTKHLPEFWCDLFKKILSMIGWPGERPLNSEEYQVQQAWDSLLKEYAHLKYIVQEISYSEAVRYLSYLLQRTLFLPNIGQTEVQVMSIVEAAGLPADYRWVVGVQQEDWPSALVPNPFIPISMQKRYGLPHSSFERERLLAKQFIQTLQEGARTIVFSHAGTVNKQAANVSSLIEHIPAIEVKQILNELPKTVWENLLATGHINTRQVDPKNNSIPILVDEKIKGGARILQLQAECPFRAFAEIRLQAKSPSTMGIGLTPRDKGDILHQVLNHFWQSIQDHRTLLALSQKDLEDTIERVVCLVLGEWQKKRPGTLKSRYYALEKQRIMYLMAQWVELEKSRPEFHVEAREKEYRFNFHSLDLTIRIDRIDRLANGELVLIDYKTGACNIYDWFGERPSAPQLPLYCILLEPAPIALAFAILSKGKVQFQGVAQEEEILPLLKKVTELGRFGAAVDWDTQKIVWEQVLAKLTKDFLSGAAHVDPRKGHSTCRFCHLEALCRVRELDLNLGEE